MVAFGNVRILSQRNNYALACVGLLDTVKCYILRTSIDTALTPIFVEQIKRK